MPLLSFFLAPIVVIVAVILIEAWLRGQTGSKQTIAVRIASGLGGYASLWLLYLLFIGLLRLLGLADFASAYGSQIRWQFSAPMGQVERAVIAGGVTVGGLLLAFLDRRLERRDYRAWLKYPLIWLLGVFGGLLVLPLVCGLAGIGLPRLESALYAGQPGLYARPLEPEVTAQLCQTLQLEPTDPRCQQAGPVYTRDFLPDLRDRYAASRVPRTQVDSEIGTFRVRCSTWLVTISDGAFQDCYYRFVRDRAYLGITYQAPVLSSGSSPPDSAGQVSGLELELDP